MRQTIQSRLVIAALGFIAGAFTTVLLGDLLNDYVISAHLRVAIDGPGSGEAGPAPYGNVDTAVVVPAEEPEALRPFLAVPSEREPELPAPPLPEAVALARVLDRATTEPLYRTRMHQAAVFVNTLFGR